MAVKKIDAYVSSCDNCNWESNVCMTEADAKRSLDYHLKNDERHVKPKEE